MLKGLVFALLCLFSGGALAGTLSAENGLELLLINGKDAKRYGDHADKVVVLSPGTYQIVARYDDEVKRGSRSTIFTSKPYVMEFEMGKEDVVLSIPKLKFESQATAFFREPIWELRNPTAGSVTVLASEKLTGSGFGSFGNMEKVIAEYNRENGIVFDGGKPQDLEDVLVSFEDDGRVSIKGDVLSQLKLWYTKATNEEKKSFKRWMVEQDFQ
ncbi:DUF2057 domain-containing protein [Grimontia hollisae]|uniref:Uncharacterized protein conserved in bacteria (DUF2057) n=1 Tax=Grimontia hollisae TaxID=673 RepID=A0A377HL81_GRIHO|nr:DUF2057 domain-containing protein [Grimontia hollisae]AMG29747.1 DUF2057 domain-containing protein [Grimontia hollisae]MDF2184175.1 DUF2057 domain-containing protein [Grimontia hollisae]STO43452.1 Uncharacterized protein conserved in bacteria (DUF2057) [Grimontia hollisae]STO56949.1 Uncharacterized protein conserved in bacteria (DUF2057) [Grimontia hollisae]STQ74811.1 Uncharacterized protein conserved in bacteria (DUF2057) [Grimontia hollisae]